MGRVRAPRRKARDGLPLGTLLVLGISSGLLNILASPPLGWYRLAFVHLIPYAFALACERRGTRLLACAACFQMVRFLGLGAYFFEPLFGLLYVGLGCLLVPMLQGLARLIPAAQRRPAVRLLLFAPLFVATEFLQAILSPLPAFLATSGALLGGSPYLGLARAGGLFGLSAFVVAVNALLAWVWLPRHWSPRGREPWRPRRLLLAAALALAVLTAGVAGSQRLLALNHDAYLRRPERSRFAAVSVSRAFAAETQRYWDDEAHDEVARLAQTEVTLIADALADHRTRLDLIVLPEDMVDFEFWGAADPEAQTRFGIRNAGPLLQLYRAVAQEQASELLCVLTTLETTGRYNSAVLLDREGHLMGVSHKTVLALAMESWPFGAWRPFYFDWVLNAAERRASPVYNMAYRYRAGTAAALFTTDRGLAFASPICIELHHPWRMATLVRRGAQALVHTSSNMGIERGLAQYTGQTMNLRRILSAWLGVPIVFCGRLDDAGIVLPDGRVEGVATGEAPFAVFWGEVRHGG